MGVISAAGGIMVNGIIMILMTKLLKKEQGRKPTLKEQQLMQVDIKSKEMSNQKIIWMC